MKGARGRGSKRSEDGTEIRMATIKKEPWGSLRKMIVLFFLETLSLFWIVETFKEIIESAYGILLKRESLIP